MIPKSLKQILSAKTTKISSPEEDLRDIIPINWSEDVLSGKIEVVISSVIKEEEDLKRR